MSKKSFIILIIAILIIGLLCLGAFLYANKSKNGGSVGSALRNLFPFGAGTPSSSTETQTGQQGQNGSPSSTVPPANVPRLRKVSNIPVVGYTTLNEQVPVNPNDVPPPTVKTIAATYTFSQDLKLGDTNADVKALQQELNQCPATQIAKSGAGSPGKESTHFGPATEKAVIAFQDLFPNVLTASGTVDDLTVKQLNAGFTCTIATPVIGQTVLESIVRYMTEGNGNIFQADADTLDTIRLSDTTIPRIHDATFAGDGSVVFMRSLEDDNETIDTVVATVPQPVPGGDALPEITGSKMPSNIVDLSVSPDDNQIFFMVPTNDALVGYVSDLTGAKQQQVFSSPFFGWLAQWATADKIIFTNKATGEADGYVYETSIANGNFQRIAGPATGLTSLMSPDGKYLLESVDQSGIPDLMVETVATGNTTDLKINTLPEKCAWNTQSTLIYCAVPNAFPAGGTYPDDWYQGTVLFTDTFWSIDPTGAAAAQELFDPLSQGGEATDGIKLSIDSANKYLYFTNKDTNILWQYDLAPTPVANTATPTTTSAATTTSGTETSTTATNSQ